MNKITLTGDLLYIIKIGLNASQKMPEAETVNHLLESEAGLRYNIYTGWLEPVGTPEEMADYYAEEFLGSSDIAVLVRVMVDQLFHHTQGALTLMHVAAKLKGTHVFDTLLDEIEHQTLLLSTDAP